MIYLIIIISIILISLVLLQSSKSDNSNMFSSGQSELFQNRKERGGELFITRTTFILGISFMIINIFM
ncbi:MAG: preprotein translocase subunit SecG [Bacilli bacterium]